jgi:hypothetical protein
VSEKSEWETALPQQFEQRCGHTLLLGSFSVKIVSTHGVCRSAYETTMLCVCVCLLVHCSVLCYFCSVMCCFVLFCSVLFFLFFCFVLFCAVLLRSDALFCSVLFCSVLLCSVLSALSLVCPHLCTNGWQPEHHATQVGPTGVAAVGSVSA